MTDYTPLIPYILLTALSLFVAILGTIPRVREARVLGYVTALGALGALSFVARSSDATGWMGFLRFDGYSRAFNTVFLVTLVVIAIASVAEERKTAFAGEFHALMVLSTMGLMLMGSSGGLMALYLGLELSTISLFALAGFSKRERRSAEAALKLLILGSVASAVVLYGASVLYGVLGTTLYNDMAVALGNVHGSAAMAVTLLGAVFVLGGLAFKIAAVPFHLWAPDVYEGSPSLVTAFLSTASKAGGFAALLRFLTVMEASGNKSITTLVVILAGVSMIVGNLSALAQTNLKRLLGYSGVAQSGYMLVAVAAGASNPRTISSALLYLLLYAFTNVGAFLIAQAIQDATGSDNIAALRGLHRRCPTLAFAAVVVMFSLGGIPPLAGFVGKLYLFAAAWAGGQKALVIIGALTSVIALYYYLMVIFQVYIKDPADARRLPVARPLGVAIAVCTMFILFIGIYPKPFVAMGENAASAVEGMVSVHAAGRNLAQK